MSTDGAQTSADYEWRIEVRGIETRPGDLGAALHRELSAEPAHVEGAAAQTLGRRCHWGLQPILLRAAAPLLNFWVTRAGPFGVTRSGAFLQVDAGFRQQSRPHRQHLSGS